MPDSVVDVDEKCFVSLVNLIVLAKLEGICAEAVWGCHCPFRSFDVYWSCLGQESSLYYI